MFSKIMKVLIAALLVAAAVNGPVAVAGQSDVDPAALQVVQSYFAALQSGDTQALLGMFAGTELERNQAQLSDPDYPPFLVERYTNARFEVADGGVQNDISYVDITIWLSDTESIRERLLLMPSEDPADSSLRIVARKELLE